MPKTSRVYFDITDLAYYAKDHKTVSGIQRTSLRIIEKIISGGKRGVHGLFKDPCKDALYTADLSFIRGEYDFADLALRFSPSAKVAWLNTKLRKFEFRPVKRGLRRMQLEVKWHLSPELRKRQGAISSDNGLCCLSDAQIHRNSVIVSLGAAWGQDHFAHARMARTKGCATVYVVYDTIPVTTPQYIPPNSYGDVFGRWIKFVARRADLLLCISSATKSDLEHYLRDHRIKAAVDVLPFPHEFIETSKLEIRPGIQAITGGDYVLYVGTIEIRKNIIGMLKAWAELAAVRAEGVPDLVLAGRRGWEVDDVYEFLDRTEFLGGKVKIVNSPNDSELAALYRNCRFTVFPSLIEGWGLPIGESLWFGKPVLCADNSSMPEAGGPFATYFSHDEPNSLKEKLGEMLDHPPALPADIRSRLRTWQDTADALLEAIDRLPRK